jgi:hypothetical protein
VGARDKMSEPSATGRIVNTTQVVGRDSR